MQSRNEAQKAQKPNAYAPLVPICGHSEFNRKQAIMRFSSQETAAMTAHGLYRARRQSAAATALWLIHSNLIGERKRCRAALATALHNQRRQVQLVTPARSPYAARPCG